LFIGQYEVSAAENQHGGCKLQLFVVSYPQLGLELVSASTACSLGCIHPHMSSEIFKW